MPEGADPPVSRPGVFADGETVKLDYIIELEDENYMVLEVNSGVGMTIFSKNVENGYEIAKDIYSKAIDKISMELNKLNCFPKEGSVVWY